MAGSSNRPKVLILGGGFGGLSCALGLSRQRFSVTVVDQKQHFEFLPAIHELVSGRKTPRNLRLPLRSILTANGHCFQRASIQAIDPRSHQVTTNQGVLAYDYLVVSLGGIDTDFGIAGVSRHALGFKSVNDCAAIGEALRRLMRSNPRAAVSVIGSGFEGIEAAGEILRRTQGSNVTVNLIDAAARPLPSAPSAVSAHLMTLCEIAGVRPYLGEPVSKVMPKTIALAGGERIRSHLTIWTAGAAPQPLFQESGLASASGWLPAQDTLLHPDFDNIFVIGDNAQSRLRLSKQAYHAMDMGTHCAENLNRLRRGRGVRDFRGSDKPQLVSFGAIDTLLLHPSLCLAGPSLAPLKEAVYQAVLAQLDRRRAPRRLANAAVRGISLPGSLRDLLSDKALALRTGVKRLV